MEKVFTAVALVAVSIFLVGCSSGDKKPEKSELESAFKMELQNYIQLSEFNVEILENMGNKVDPMWGSRLKAVLYTTEPFYILDEKEEKTVFVALKSKKSTKIEIYGKIYSTLFQGKWEHEFEVDGDPFDGLGQPLNQFEGEKIIIRGSQDEKEYFAQYKNIYNLYYDAIENKKTIIGKAWSGKDSWLCKLKSNRFDKKTGDFNGEIHWLNLNAIHKISGKLSYGKLFFKEDEIIQKSDAVINCRYNLPLIIKDGNINGTWNECGGSGEIQLSISEMILNDLHSIKAEAIEKVRENGVDEKIIMLYNEAITSIKSDDFETANRNRLTIQQMIDHLENEYTLQIVQRQGEKSGLWRKSKKNSKERKYYLIVEAISPNGKRLKLPIESGESGKVSNVEVWGIGVEPHVYESVKQDKLNDGVINNNIIGTKKNGFLSIDYEVAVTRGEITEW